MNWTLPVCKTPSSMETSMTTARSYSNRLTRNNLSVSLPPCNNFRNVGLLRPRTFWSMGSSVLIVLDRGLDLTTQTRTFPRQIPALKNEVCDDILLARFRPAIGSMGSNASSGNVITCRSGEKKISPTKDHKKSTTSPDKTISS